MTGKRFYAHKQMSTVLEYECAIDDTTKKELTIREVMDLLNKQHETIQKLHQTIFELRTKLALERTEKEEYSDSVYDFQGKLEKW